MSGVWYTVTIRCDLQLLVSKANTTFKPASKRPKAMIQDKDDARIQCGYCREAAMNPYHYECGHLVCQSCVVRIVTNYGQGQPAICATCKSLSKHGPKQVMSGDFLKKMLPKFLFDDANIVAPSTCSVDKAPAKDEIKKDDKIEVKAQLEADEEKNVEIKKEPKEKQMTRFQMHENHSKCSNYMFTYPPDVDFCYCKICHFKMQRHLECYECVDCAKMFTPKGCWIMPVMFGRGDPKTTNQRCPECFWADKKRRFQANQEREEIHKRKRELDQKRREERKLRRTYEVKQDAFDLMELTMDENSPVGKLWQSLHDAGISRASALYKGIKERNTPAWKQWQDFKHVQAQEQRIMETVD